METVDGGGLAGPRPPRTGLPRWVGWVMGFVLVGLVVYVLRAVLTPVFFAFLIAYLLDPVVDRLETWKIPRGLAITLILIVFLGATGVFLLLFVPAFVRDIAEVAKDVPGRLHDLFEAWEPVLVDRGIPVPHSLEEATEQLSVDAQDVAGRAAGPAMHALSWIVGGTASVVGAVLGILMVPVFAFYLLYDFDRIVAYADGLVPPRMRTQVRGLAREVDGTIGLFVRGQLAVMLILAGLYAIGYSIVGIRLAVPIGILAGLLSFIPYVGAVLGVGLALAMCGLHFEGWEQLIGVLVVYGVVQLLEGFLITPKILGDKVGLSSLWVLLALMIGGELFGFLGVLLAVPVAAVVKIFVARGLRFYRASALFGPELEPATIEGAALDAPAEARSGSLAPAAATEDEPSAPPEEPSEDELAPEPSEDEGAPAGPPHGEAAGTEEEAPRESETPEVKS